MAAGALLALTACGTPPSPGAASDTAGGDVLTVHAASSLRVAFAELAARFEAEHVGVRVWLNVAGSTELVAQLAAGAPGDVLAVADEATMARAVAGGVVSGPAATLATNTLAIAVPLGNPAGIRSFADLAEPGVDLVVCEPSVPCGAATDRVERASGVALSPVSEEASVAGVLGKVAAGEADAGVVYASDIATSPHVESVAIPGEVNVTTRCRIAVTAGATAAGLAADFVALALDTRGRTALQRAGFGQP